MHLTKEEKNNIINKYGKNAQDTGLPEVQIALLTVTVKKLTEHFKTHKKDQHSLTGLYKMVGKRRHLLKYLQTKNSERYTKIIKSLGLRR